MTDAMIKDAEPDLAATTPVAPGLAAPRNESIADRARAAAPALAAADAGSGSLRRLSDESWNLITDTGILQALQPKRWGGAETSVVDFAEGVIEIGRSSASAGWVSSVVGVHPWQIALFSEEGQQDVWGANPARALASSYTPTGTIEKVPGGYRVSGRWSFSSGIERCDGVILGSIDGEREIKGRSYPDFISAVLNRDQYTIEDVWHTGGLKGTGSNNIVVDGAFVPAHRVQSHLEYTKGLGAPLPGQQRNTAALYRVPWAVLFNLIIAAGALGSVYGFLDLWTAETAGRRTNYGTLLRDEPIVQDRLAEATFAIDGARLRLVRAGREILEIAEANEVPSEEQRAYYRWDLAKGAQSAVDAVSDLMRSASGRTAYVEHPLHGKFQDVMAASGHAFLFSDPLGRAYAGRKLGSTKVPEVHL
jgi:3-hydroxy-9,10-secoandrosta-1,3,5(10)-triene-9,17-dione monooxygenase